SASPGRRPASDTCGRSSGSKKSSPILPRPVPRRGRAPRKPTMNDAPSEDYTVDDLAEEFARRWREGERPSIDDYANRFPQWAEDIRELFPAVVMMEQLKPQPQPSAPATPRPAETAAPQRLGDYRIVREIGRGGMGVVYEAQHEALDRRVAVKVLPAHLLRDEKRRQRFRRESQAAARLHHT